MRRVGLFSLGFVVICKAGVVIAGDCSQDEEPQPATDAYTAIITGNKATAGIFFSRADAFRTAGELSKAGADYSKAISINPGNGGSYFARGNANRREGPSNRACLRRCAG